jgi:hypothetical protein
MGVTKIRQNQIESISAANADSAIEAGAISVSRLVAGAGEGAITDSELSYLKGLEGSVQQQLDKRLKEEKLKDSTQIADWSDDTVAVTAKAIADMVAKKIGDAQISGVMTYNGAWSKLEEADGTIDTSEVKAGETFCYDKGEMPYGHTLEPGDMLIAAVDEPSMSDEEDWTVVQTNISGAVTSLSSSTKEGALAVFGGTKGNTIKASTLSGLLKLEDGVVKVAAKEDLPAHDHKTDVKSKGVSIGSFTDVLNLVTEGILSISWDADKGALVFGVTPQVSNGVPEEGKYVAGISVNEEGKLVLVYKSFPDGGLKTGVALEGVQDGSNVVFLMPETCADASETVILNGVILTRGVDYTIAENRKITFAADSCIPKSDDILRVNYIKK